MSDYRDVMHARSAADVAVSNAGSYGGAIEDGRTGDVSLALMLATSAICAELRALGVTLDYVIRDSALQQ